MVILLERTSCLQIIEDQMSSKRYHNDSTNLDSRTSERRVVQDCALQQSREGVLSCMHWFTKQEGREGIRAPSSTFASGTSTALPT